MLPTTLGVSILTRGEAARAVSRSTTGALDTAGVLVGAGAPPARGGVLVGRRPALSRDFNTMFDDLRASLGRLDRQAAKAAPKAAPKNRIG